MAKKSANDAAIEAAKSDFHARHAEDGGIPVLSEKNLKFEEGVEVIGRLAKEPYAMSKSYAIDLEIATDNGPEVVSYWCPTILRNLLKKVREGDMLAILCVGSTPTPNGDAYEFALSKLKG